MEFARHAEREALKLGRIFWHCVKSGNLGLTAFQHRRARASKCAGVVFNNHLRVVRVTVAANLGMLGFQYYGVSVSAVADDSLATTIVDNSVDAAQETLNWLGAHAAQWWRVLTTNKADVEMISALIGIIVVLLGGVRFVWGLLMRSVERRVELVIQGKLAESARDFSELIVPRMEEVKTDIRREIDGLHTEINEKLEAALKTEKRLARLESGKKG